MVTETGVRASGGGEVGRFGGEDVGQLLCGQRRGGDREAFNPCRSGSAPPTVEGSLAAVSGLFGATAGGAPESGFLSEEELRSDPAYAAYYYSHVKLNPRLPPPVVSKEDWRFSQRLQAGVIGGRRQANRGEDGGSRSLFSQPPPGFAVEPKAGLAFGRQKIFADILQDDFTATTTTSRNSSRTASRNILEDGVESLRCAETNLALYNEISSVDVMQPRGSVQSVSTSDTFASVLGSSLSRNTTPDSQTGSRTPRHPPVGMRHNSTDMSTNNGSYAFNSASESIVDSENILAALSGMSLSTSCTENIAQSKLQKEIGDQRNFPFNLQGGQNYNKQHPFRKISEPADLGMSSIQNSAKSMYSDSAKMNGGLVDSRNSASMSDAQIKQHMAAIPCANSYLKGQSAPSITNVGNSACYQNVDGTNSAFTSYGLSGNSSVFPSMMVDHTGTYNLPPLFENASAAPATASFGIDSRVLGGALPSGSNLTGVNNSMNFNRIGNHKAEAALQTSLADPLFIQYLKTAGYAAQAEANFGNPSMERGYMGNSYMDSLEFQKAYLGTLFQSQEQNSIPFLAKSVALSHAYYGSSLATPMVPVSPVGLGSPHRRGERNIHFPSGLRNFTGGIMGWHSDSNGNMEANYPSSLLEEFKNNKSRYFELYEIEGHVVEFSADQYGSRFIQQKLETATTAEKDMVYEEIKPQALSLMTDVFGNYVVQKFFEHGSATQIRELANQLNGHILALSLQMYGCRVIQKAIEIVNLDQKTRIVAELEGHIMRCVRDQNGNHVIQKCIECIPQDAIQFIISTFFDQIVTLSTHPYGCRVVQRILEHCDNPKTQEIVMDEIMQCICMLAQDQYGNYVVQHVLEHGKPNERSAIIEKLTGQIVQMSQQKFASNVVEKCLTFCSPEERQTLVNEMLGSTDENEPLQIMMKDQFGNYVVQKVLETCNDQQRELILTRIKIHLSALKKYTYGKHIVARIEKLVAAGERRIGLQFPYPFVDSIGSCTANRR